MSDRDEFHRLFDRLPVESIEFEMEKILAWEHGLAGIRVFIDRQSGAVTCSQHLADDLKGRVFALAAKRAIIRSVRDQEDRDGG